MSTEPWTFVPFEVEPTPSWTVYDDNLARIVAVFYAEDEATAYLAWRNKKQAKARARQEAKARARPQDFRTALGEIRRSW